MEGYIYIIVLALLILIILYGYKREKKITSLLSSILYGKASGEIEAYLKKYERITYSEAKEVISDLRASVFWSRKAIIINDSSKYTNIVLESMVNEGKLLYYEYDTNRVYKLKIK
ncbi:MAG: hypothetical protein LIR50_12155 [Bacillota bacterium]|nr:hypothetical protein [Bacillota bacterium]